MSKYRTLVETLSATRALRARRDVLTERLTEARLQALAPEDPRVATLSYKNALGNLTDRAEKLISRHVLANMERGPVALEHGLVSLELELTRQAAGIERFASAAFKRATEHSRLQAQRILNVKLPSDPHALEAARQLFVDRQVQLMQAAARRQVVKIRQALATGDSKTELLEKIWVMRNGGNAVARNEVFKLFREELGRYASATGSVGGFVVTHPDDKVRPTHAANHGKFFYWAAPPPEFAEPECRCRMTPAEPALE